MNKKIDELKLIFSINYKKINLFFQKNYTPLNTKYCQVWFDFWLHFNTVKCVYF